MRVSPAPFSALTRRLALPWFPALDGSDRWKGLGDSPLSKLPPLPCWSQEGGGRQGGPQLYLFSIYSLLFSTREGDEG